MWRDLAWRLCVFAGLGMGMATIFTVSQLGVANFYIAAQCVVAPTLILTGMVLWMTR